MSARVADVMTTDGVAVRASTSFKQIAARLRNQGVSAFPVLSDDGTVIGVVSEADLLPKEALEAGYEGHRGWLSRRRHRQELAKAAGMTAADAHLMYDCGITCLPVTGTGGKLAGMLSRAEVLSVFGRPDEQIRREIIEKVIIRMFHADPASFTITVSDGVVTLQTSGRTTAIGHQIAAHLRHMEGVIAVREPG